MIRSASYVRRQTHRSPIGKLLGTQGEQEGGCQVGSSCGLRARNSEGRKILGEKILTAPGSSGRFFPLGNLDVYVTLCLRWRITRTQIKHVPNRRELR